MDVRSSVVEGMNNESSSEIANPAKLLIISQFYPPDFAPTGQLLEELAHELSQQNIEIQVFTGQPGYAFQKTSAPSLEKKDKIAIRRSRVSRFWPQRIRGKVVSGLLFCLRASLYLFKNHPREQVLLVTTAPPYLSLIGYLAKLFFKIPYICLVYDLYPDVAIALQVVPKHHWIARLWSAVNQVVWQQAQQIIVLSPTMKERIVQKYPAIADKITVIHSWADPQHITPRPKQENWFAQEHRLAEKFTVLYSGNIGRCHDMDTILEAAHQLCNEAIQFVFIGNGARRQACLDRVSELGLSNCLFLPYQDKQTLPYSLTACDLSLVSVSVGMEGLVAPSKFYGTLAAGRPVAVICEPNSYLRQILSDADCGKAFLSGDGLGLAKFIRYLAKDPQLANQMGNGGRRYLLSHFTPEIIARQYAQLLAPHPISSLHTATHRSETIPRLNSSWLTKLVFSRKT